MRIAMVGLGDIARKAYLPVVATHGDISPIICTRNSEVLKHVKRQYRINEAYGALDDLIRAQPAIAMIHTSTESHYEIAKRLLDANIPLLIDKPVSYHYHQTAELVELAAKKQLPLLVGFNRRFAPLYQPLQQASVRQVYYQKNRVNRPAEAHEFVFDDFIHVLDFVRFTTPGEPEDFQVYSYSSDGLLGSVQVQWQCERALFTASMNRLNGVAEEQLRYASDNEHWEINNLSSGCHYKNGAPDKLEFNDWQPTLEKRGFVAMIDNMLNVIRSGKGGNNYEDILATHKLCEDVVTQIEARQ